MQNIALDATSVFYQDSANYAAPCSATDMAASAAFEATEAGLRFAYILSYKLLRHSKIMAASKCAVRNQCCTTCVIFGRKCRLSRGSEIHIAQKIPYIQ